MRYLLRKMGIYMGIFNFFIVLPQIVNALIGGWIVHDFFSDYAIYYVASGFTFLIAGLLTLRIKSPCLQGTRADQRGAVHPFFCLRG